LEEFQLAGLDVRDLLDAQSLIWILANDESPAFASWRGEPTAAGEEPWLRPLEHPRGLEAELQRILAAGSTEDTREILGAIFRRAILLHQRTRTEGFLGVESSNPRTFSIMVGNLFACAAGRVLYLLVDDDLHVRERYEVGVSGLANNELAWAKVDRQRLWLDKLLDDEELWVAYERMLGKFASFPRAKSNHNNVGKMSVLTGERLGQSDEKLADLVTYFRQQRGYPTDNDKENLAAREEFASYLSPKAIKNLDWNKFMLIANLAVS